MKQVMIYAYTRFNFGDDLLINTLCERYPNTRFILHAPKAYKHTFKQLKNIRIHSSDTLFIRGIRYIFRLLRLEIFYLRMLGRNCDAFVHIGGSLFIQQADWKKNMNTTKAMQIKGKPFFLLGANFGPFSDKDFLRQHKAIFQTYTDICFREKHSYDLFKDLSNVRKAEDIIFQLDKIDIVQQEKSIVISVIKPSVRKHLSAYDALYYQKMKETAIYFIDKGYQVSFISFCETEKDDEAINMIVQAIPPEYTEHIKKHFYRTNIEKTLQIMARSQLVVATRFHAMIVGWVFHKPVFPIIYSDKMTHVLEDIRFNGGFTDFAHLEKLEAEQIFHHLQTDPIDVSEQVKHAAKQFMVLDAFLTVKKV